MNNEARGLVNKAVKQKNMNDVFLLTVRDHFQLSDIGLIVHPDFSVRDNKKWNDYYSEARIVYKEGNESVLEVHISTWQFNIRDPNVDIDKRWRVVLSFPDGNKELIPIGSKIFVSEPDYRNIQGKKA